MKIKCKNKLIAVYGGHYAIVSREDFKNLQLFKWHLNKGYPRTTVPCSNGKKIYMHQLVLSAPKGLFIDHINNNPLDNRRENLRLVTKSQNGQNRKNKNAGVSFHSRDCKWQARIKLEGKDKHLGYFKSKKEALKIVKEWRKAHYI